MTTSIEGIRGSDLEWTIVADTDISLPAAMVKDYSFRWGAQQSHRRAPVHFHAGGYLLLNQLIEENQLETYEGLRIAAGGFTYFDLVIVDYERSVQSQETRLVVQSRGSAGRDDLVEYNFTPTPDDPTTRIDQLVSTGMNIVTDQHAAVAPIGIVTHGDPERSQFRGSASISQVLRLMEGGRWVLLVEDVRASEPTWKMLPMPLTARVDQRTPGRRYSALRDVIVADSLTRARSRHWPADEYTANLAGHPFQAENEQSRFDLTSRYDGSFPFYMGRSRARDWRAIAWDQNIAESFAGFTGVEVTDRLGFQGPIEEYVAPDGSYAGILARSDTTAVRLTINRKWLEWRDSWGAQQQTIFATGVDESEKRRIDGGQLIYYNIADNQVLLQRLIDDWNNWSTNYGTVEFVIEDLGSESPARQAPGDRVPVFAGDFNEVCVITSCQWRIRGNSPLRVTWEVFTDQAVPHSRMYLGDNAHPLYLGSTNKPMYMER